MACSDLIESKQAVFVFWIRDDAREGSLKVLFVDGVVRYEGCLVGFQFVTQKLILLDSRIW